MKNKVSVIIAAKDEAPRIGRVLKVLCAHPLVDEVIVVNDGSTDSTEEVCEKYKATVLNRNEEPHGKTSAVRQGLTAAKNDIIALIDADLKGLTAADFTKLVEPVVNGQVDFTLSVRGNSSHIYKIFKMDFVSGERAIRKELLSDPEIWSKPKIGYGLEVLMNDSLLKRKKKFVSVYLPHLYATPKSEKMSFWRGSIADLTMVANIFRAFPFYAVGWQFLEMIFLNYRYKKDLHL